MDADGNPLWASGGILVCGAAFDQYFPVIVSDGSGGAIIAWQDVRSSTGESDIYAQRINSSGVAQWAADGVPVSIYSGDQSGAAIVPDGSGGFYAAWRDTRSDLFGGTSDVYAQYINAAGQRAWASDLPLATSVYQSERDITGVSDGQGNAIFVWQDARSVSSTGRDIYAQKVDTAGNLLWGSGGLVVCTASGDQRFPDTAPDGSGGVLICWDDYRSSNYDVYAQRVTGSGSIVWQANGVGVCVISASSQVVPTIAPDGSGGAYVAWTDARAGTSAGYYDIYAQRVSAAGSLMWAQTGVAVCTEQGWQGRIKSAPDGSGNVLFTWSDNRVDPTNTTYNYDVYGQKLDSAGIVQWAASGVAVCAATGKQELHQMAQVGGGTVVVWQDARVTTDKNIYAQKIGASGSEVIPVASVREAKSRPDGSLVSISSKVVTAVYSDSFYIQDADRVSGIRVDGTGVTEGQVVNVEGELGIQNGERVLINAVVSG